MGPIILIIFTFVLSTTSLASRALHPRTTADVVVLPADRRSPSPSSSLHSTQQLPAEIWAGGHRRNTTASLVNEVRALLGEAPTQEVAALCGRTLYHSLTFGATAHDLGQWTFISTGDIKDMWIRDSAVQVGIYLSRVSKRPALRRLVEGALRAQAFFITQDPYANAYSASWRRTEDLSKFERQLGRGGWIATRNYELDSGAYFMNLLWNYYVTPGVHAPQGLIGESLIYDAVSLMVDTWTTEQHHEESSTYRYSELPREGVGSPTSYTGMTWSGFRPSDDPNTYGYNVPGNIYAAGALQRVLVLNTAVWNSEDLGARVSTLLKGIEDGIRRWGVVEVEPGVKVYAYEVDGLGSNLTDFDDANVPSLLAIPLLGWTNYDRGIYQTTRARLLDKDKNRYYFKGAEIEGIGSPHTGQKMVWPMAVAMEALTTEDPHERVRLIRSLLKMQCGNGLMHESVNVDNLNHCTRPIFEWANALAVVVAEAALGIDCESEAEKFRLKEIADREVNDQGTKPANGGADLPLYYQGVEAAVAFETPAKALGRR